MKFTRVVGAPVMEALTAGTYDGNANCIREYVQNAADSGSSKIEVYKENDNEIVIRDFGSGMDVDELFKALHLGKSSKSNTQAGWRGIGIFSGVPNFHKIYINTKKQGEDKLHVEIDCDKMRSIYNGEKEIEEILEESISEQIEHLQDTNFKAGTEIRLSGVLLNQEFFFTDSELERFLVSSVPLPFKDTPFTKRVIAELKKREINEPLFETYYNNKKLYREPLNPDVFLQESLSVHEFRNGKTTVAIAWFVLNKENKELSGPMKGLVFKKKGFTIGDANTVRRLYPKSYNFWSYGEIHVVDPAIRENAGRNNLEITSGNTGWLFREIREFLGELQHTHRYKSSKDRRKNIEKAKEEIKGGVYGKGSMEINKAEKSMTTAPKPSSNPAFKEVSEVITDISIKQVKELNNLKKEITKKKTDESDQRIASILEPLDEKDAKEVRKKLEDSGKVHEMFNHPMKDVISKIRTMSKVNSTETRKLLRETFSTAFADNPTEVKNKAKLLLTTPEKIFENVSDLKPAEVNYPYYITSGLGQAIYEFYNVIVNGEKHYSGGLLSLLLEGKEDETKARAYRDMYFAIEFLGILVDSCTENENGSQ